MRVSQYQRSFTDRRSFTVALTISVVSHTAAVSLLLITRNVDRPALPSRPFEVVLMPQRLATSVQPPSPETLERRTAPKVESDPKSVRELDSKPLPALPAKAPVADASPIKQQSTARAPVADASPITQQPTTEAPTPPLESQSVTTRARQDAVAESSAFPGHADDAGIYLPPRVTHWDLHKNDPVTVTGPVFPGHAEDAGYRLPPRVTYADLVGKKKADEACAACHGPGGRKPATPETPRLAGLQQGYFVQALIEYRKGTRDNGVMTAVAKPLTENEIRDLAWYFSRRR